ncbi:MAG TPA: type IV pilus assembly protein PilM [Syntrophales bacterium]|jgi:type IV pilus assembly protein PilM|nr:type IV pilus assembly protein PilM [Syntrophales bacterium]HQA83204.1 type IV pilus assembly protein PilM [Syntrophales bacterium]
MGNFSIKDLFSSKKQLAGLDIGSSSLKLAEIDGTAKGYILRSYHEIPLPKGVVSDGLLEEPQILTAKIKELFALSGSKRRNVVTSLSGNSVISQKVSFMTMTPDELRGLIQDEAGKYLPFDSMEDVSYDFQILGENEFNPTQMDVMLVAAKTEIVDSFADAIKSAGLTAAIMDVDSFALETMYEENYDFEGDDVAVLVNIGASMTNINVVRSGGSVLRRDFALGGNHITEGLQQSMELASFEEAERLKIQGPEGDAEEKQRFRDNLLASADPICSEIERSIDYFRSTYGGSEIKVILLSGGSANIPGLADNLRQRLNIETEIMNPFKKIGYNQKQFTAEEVERIGPSAAVCVGLALRKLGDK